MIILYNYSVFFVNRFSKKLERNVKKTVMQIMS